MKPFIYLFLGSILFTTSIQAKETLNLSDTEILSLYDYLNTVDIQTGKIAQEKATDDTVRATGRMIVMDHTKMRDKARQLGRNNGIAIDASLNVDLDYSLETILPKLKVASEKDFNRAYMSHEIAFSNDMINHLTKLTPTIKNKELKDYIAGHLSQLDEHLGHIKMASNNLFGKATTAAMGDTYFYARLDQASSFEIEASGLGASKGHTKIIRNLASKIQHDHMDIQQEVRDVANQNGIIFTINSNNKAANAHAAALTGLKSFSGKDFDTAYLDNEVSFHNSVIKLIKISLLPNINNKPFKAQVEKALARYELNLTQINNISKDLHLNGS